MSGIDARVVHFPIVSGKVNGFITKFHVPAGKGNKCMAIRGLSGVLALWLDS